MVLPVASSILTVNVDIVYYTSNTNSTRVGGFIYIISNKKVLDDLNKSP